MIKKVLKKLKVETYIKILMIKLIHLINKQTKQKEREALHYQYSQNMKTFKNLHYSNIKIKLIKKVIEKKNSIIIKKAKL